MIRKLLLLLCITIFLLGAAAHAAQLATVDVDQAELRSGPSRLAPMLDRLAKGALVTAANVPIEGFFKVRTSGGAIGWVESNALILKAPPLRQPSLSEGGKGPDAAAVAGRQGNSWALKFLGDLAGFRASDLESLTGIVGIANGFGFGVELSHAIVPEFSLLLRVERLSKSLIGTESISGRVFDIAVATTPVSAGLDYLFLDGREFRSSVGLMLGFGMGTKLTSTGISYASPNVTELSGTAFSAVARMDLHYRFSQAVSGFVEAGYRVFKTAQLVPSVEGNGSEIFAVGGEYVPVAIDLSGFMLGAGLSFAF